MLFHYQIRNYYLYDQSADMRSGIDSLSGLVRNQLQKNPLSGDLFIFVNKRKTEHFEKHFNIQIGDLRKMLLQIKERKTNPTKFIDSLKAAVLEKLEEKS